MAEDSRPGLSGVASVVLALATIVVSVVLALLTDLSLPVRWGIAVLAGVVAAGVTTALVGRAKRS